MTKALLIFTGVLLHITLCAQYTYFNSSLGPLGGIEAGNGNSTNLLIVDSQIISVANYLNSGNIAMAFNVQNMEGEWIDQMVNETNGQMLANYADSFSQYEGGILGAGFFFEGPWPSIRWFDENYQLTWEKQVPLFFDETNEPVYYSEQIYGEFHFAKPLSSGGFLAAGPMTYNFGPGEHYQNLWLCRYDANHEIVWNKEYSFHANGVMPEDKLFLRVNKLFEMTNGDLLVWGCWYHAWMPMVLRFDSEGNFLEHVSWGAPGPTDTLNDWLPWPVQIGEEEFLFAYKHGTIFEDFILQYSKPRIGHFDASTMEVTLFDPIDREAKYHWLYDFVKAVDNGYVALGKGTRLSNDSIPIYEEATYLLKVNNQGEEVWYHEYQPPMNNVNPDGYDLEVTPDGGYAFVGNFTVLDDEGNITNEKRQWVVKTDACGELVYNGCEVVVSTTEIQHYATPDILVWPNPTSGMLNIQLPVANAAQIEVFDIRGQTVYHHSFPTSQKEFTLDLSRLAQGLYGLRVISAKGAPLGYTKVLRH